MEQELFTAEEISAREKISPATRGRWVKSGKLIRVRIPGKQAPMYAYPAQPEVPEAQQQPEPQAQPASEETAAGLIAKMTRSHDAMIEKLEASLQSCSPGTNSYTRILSAIADEMRKHAAFLQSSGIIPTDLGTATRSTYVYRAIVDRSPAKMYVSPEDEKVRDALDKEFGYDHKC